MLPKAPSPHLFASTARAREIGQLRAYFESKQYAGRPDFWTGLNAKGEKVPLRERAPCIVYPLPKASVRHVVRFCFGEGRFPTLKVEPAAEGEAEGLSEEEATELERALAKLVDACEVKSLIRRMMEKGLAHRTAVVLYSVRDGCIEAELPEPEHCWPAFANDRPDGDVERLTWCYLYTAEVERNGRIEVDHLWFRRDYDAKNVTRYHPAKWVAGEAPKWSIEAVESHGLGFCPARWVRNMPESDGCLDGVSLYEGLLNEFDALNFAFSQRHRGIHMFGVPQPYETGVDPDDGPEASARTSVRGYSPDDDGAGAPFGKVAEPARALAPDSVWSYQNPTAKVGLLETTGEAFNVTTKHVDDIKARILEAMSVVMTSTDDVVGESGEVTAKLLALLYAPQLALVDELRDACWWPKGLRAVLTDLLRIVIATKGEGLLVPNAKEIASKLEKVLVDTSSGPKMLLPTIKPIWGEYFTPGNNEIQVGVQTAVAAKDGGLVQPKTATQFVANHFGVTNVDEELEAAQEAAEERAAKALEHAQAMRPAAGPDKGDKGDEAESKAVPPGADPKKPPKAKAPNAQGTKAPEGPKD